MEEKRIEVEWKVQNRREENRREENVRAENIIEVNRRE